MAVVVENASGRTAKVGGVIMDRKIGLPAKSSAPQLHGSGSYQASRNELIRKQYQGCTRLIPPLPGGSRKHVLIIGNSYESIYTGVYGGSTPAIVYFARTVRLAVSAGNIAKDTHFLATNGKRTFRSKEFASSSWHRYPAVGSKAPVSAARANANANPTAPAR
jgi:hypothetical protein